MITTPCEALVDDLGPLYDNGGEHWWRVTVRTPPGWPTPQWRVYLFKAWTDSQAGQMGLGRFAEEIDGRPQPPILMV